MLIKKLSFIILCALFSLQVTNVKAQQPEDTLLIRDSEVDTPLIRSNDTENSGKNILAADSSIPKAHNPKTATFRSAVLPGWGQAYNKKYWKIPIIYAALGTTTGVFFYNIKSYQEARMAVIYRSDSDTTNDHLVSSELAPYTTENIRQYRNILRQNIDYSVLVFLLFWALNVVDATVDGHLKAFDVGPDITMKIKPGFNYMNNSAGLSLVFSLGDKKPKHLMPLP